MANLVIYPSDLPIGDGTPQIAVFDDTPDASRGTLMAFFWETEQARLYAAAPDLLAALEGCADALKESGKSFALNNPMASRPNLFELHESVARAAIAKAKGE